MKRCFLAVLLWVLLQQLGAKPVIVDNGYRLYDTAGQALHAHGGGVLEHDGWYYWFGENRNFNDSDTFFAVSCYRSRDLKTWEFRNHVLRRNMDPDLEFAKIERPKVIYNPTTSRFVMWMHKEWGSHYGEARCAVASCDTPDGDYSYHGSFRPLDYMSRDCTLFVDDNGAAYFLSAANNNADLHLYRLADDFLEPDYLVTKIWAGQSRESPCLFKRNGVYFIVSSGTTGWNPNQAKYGSAMNLAGPWSGLSNLGSSSTSFRTQPHYVLTIQGTAATSFLYMGDRWARAWGDYTGRSRYVWMPLEFPDNTSMSMPYYDALAIDVRAGTLIPARLDGWRKVDDGDADITYSGDWGIWQGNPGYGGTEHYSATAGSRATYRFTGNQARYYGFLRNDLGYADIFLDGELVESIDCYSAAAQYEVVLYETPALPNAPHTLTVEVTGEYNPAAVDDNGEIIVDAFACYVPSESPPATDIRTNTPYRIMNRNSGKILTVGGPDKNAAGAPLVQFPFAYAAHQLWLFEPQPDDSVFIRNAHSGKVADVAGGAPGYAPIVQNTAGDRDSQRWHLIDIGTDKYKIQNRSSGSVMDIQDGSFDNGAADIQFTDNGGDNQQWLLLPRKDQFRHIWIEAESAANQPGFSPFTVAGGGALPTDDHIVVPNGAGVQTHPPAGGICEYRFTTDVEGYVRIRLLGQAASIDDNEVYIRLNAQPCESMVLQEHPVDYLLHHWAAQPLAAGMHTLSIAWQEDGVKLDKIWIQIEPILYADYNNSGRVNLLDFNLLSRYWQQSAGIFAHTPEATDDIGDLAELMLLSEEWLK